MTPTDAQRPLQPHDQGQRGGYRDNPVDALAAALLLEGWLEQQPNT